MTNSDYIKEDGTMTKKCFDGTLKFHNKVLVAYRKYRPADVPQVEKAIAELKAAYPQFAQKEAQS